MLWTQSSLKHRGAAMAGRVFRATLFAASLAAVTHAGSAQSATSLSTDEVVSRLVEHNELRASQLKHYENCRYYSVDYVGFPSEKSAEMVVDMSYSAPAQKQFRIVKQQGSRLLLDHVLTELIHNEKEALEKENLGRTDLTPKNYDFRLVGTDTIAGKAQYVLEVAPRFKSKFLYNGKIWVDANDFAVSRVLAQPAKNVSFWINHTAIEHEYKKVGQFWLPASNTSTAHVRFGGTAKLKIDYREYRIGEAKPGAASDLCTQPERQISQKR
jgi:hypothetical protein